MGALRISFQLNGMGLSLLMPEQILRDAERQQRRSHAEHGNDNLLRRDLINRSHAPLAPRSHAPCGNAVLRKGLRFLQKMPL